MLRDPGTGRLALGHLRLDEQPIEQPVTPTIISNDETLELHAVLAGKVLGQLVGATAAPYIRAGRLVPVLLNHMSDVGNYFVYFGNRQSQPARARAFVDLVVERLTDRAAFVLSGKELGRSKNRSPH